MGLAAAGCAARGPHVDAMDGRVAAALASLVPGTSTRDDVVTEWGPPSGRFEGDRILTYRLDGRYAVPRNPGPEPWSAARYSLVLVFDSRGVLERHRLIQVR